MTPTLATKTTGPLGKVVAIDVPKRPVVFVGKKRVGVSSPGVMTRARERERMVVLSLAARGPLAQKPGQGRD